MEAGQAGTTGRAGTAWRNPELRTEVTFEPHPPNCEHMDLSKGRILKKVVT